MMRAFLASTLLIGMCGVGLFETSFSLAAPAVEKPEPWGTIKGRVVWADLKLPEPKEIEITADKDAIQESLKDQKLLSEEWVVNKDNRGVRWAVIWLAPPKPADLGARPNLFPVHPQLAKVETTDLVINATCGRFEPHVLALRDDQHIGLKNNASFNCRFLFVCPNGNTSQGPLGPSARVNLGTRDAADAPHSLTSKDHSWMQAWVWVFDHPYFAVTDADGKFELKNAPAGECRLFMWHETAGWLSKGGGDGEPLTIKAGGLKDLGDVDAKEP